jgi:hypothetical protein
LIFIAILLMGNSAAGQDCSVAAPVLLGQEDCSVDVPIMIHKSVVKKKVNSKCFCSTHCSWT